jgi:outer membrane protein assembly factor BamA
LRTAITIYLPCLNLNIKLKRSLRQHQVITRFITGLFILLVVHGSVYSQQKQTPLPDSLHFSKEVDIFEIIRKWTGKPPKITSDTPQERVKNLSLLPIVGYSPANGFVVGAAVSITNYLGNPKTTRLSTALLNASFTTKKQILLNLRFDRYLKENKWYISGDNRLLFFAQPTYGLGIYGLQNQVYTFGLNGSNVNRSDSAQDMRFNYIRLYETVSRRIANHWYAGMGLMIDYDFNIKDQSLSLDSPQHLSSHYVYSKAYGFDTAHYSTNGLSFQLIHDSRDNPVSPFKGNYLNLAFRWNTVAFGSTQNSTMLYTEWRNYIGVSKRRPRNLIAFWYWGVMVTSGKVPYLALPSITWDTYNRSGRGYIQGRFRGENMFYAESEFRYQISQDGLFGGVLFVNATTASNPLTKQKSFDSIAPGYGFGLRLKMNKSDRTNIAIDYGMGDGFAGIYFNIREAF